MLESGCTNPETHAEKAQNSRTPFSFLFLFCPPSLISGENLYLVLENHFTQGVEGVGPLRRRSENAVIAHTGGSDLTEHCLEKV